MSRIFKYPLRLSVGDRHEVMMPKGARVLSVDVQYREPTLWAQVDEENEPEKRVFRLVGTGHDFADQGARFIGTVILLNGDLVLHVFEEGR